MASSRDIRAGRAYVELGTNDKIEQGLRAAERRLHAFGKSVALAGAALAGIGAAVGGALFAAAKQFSDMGDRIAKAATRTGVRVEELSALAYAAEQSGSSLEGLETGLRKMQKLLGDAAEGSKEATDTLGHLGLSFESLKGLAPEEQFGRFADKIGRIRDPALQAAAAMKVFGKSGTELIPLIAGGAAGIDALTKRARELGLVMSTEDAKAAEAFGDILSDVWSQVKMLTFNIGAAVAEALLPFLEAATRIIAKIIAWVHEHRRLAIIIGLSAAAFVAAGAALVAFGLAASLLGAAFGGIVALAGAASAVVFALLTPLGLTTAAAVLLGVVIAKKMGAGVAAVSWLKERFAVLASEASDAANAIGNALAAGDIQLAARVLWTYLRLEFQRGWAFLQKGWERFKQSFVTTAAGAFYGAQLFAYDFAHDVKAAWIELTAFLGKAWTHVSSIIATAWDATTRFISDRILDVMGLLGQLTDAQVSAAKAANGRQSTDTSIGIEQEKEQALQDNEAERLGRREQNDRRTNEALDEVGSKFKELTEGAKVVADEKIAQSERELETLKAQFKALQTETDAARKGASKDQKYPSKDEIIGSAKSAGTFNPNAIFGLGAADPMRQTAQNTKDAKVILNKLLDAFRGGGQIIFGN